MSVLSTAGRALVDLCTFTGAAALGLLIVHLLALAVRWYVYHRLLGAQSKRLAEWTRCVAAYADALEQEAEARIVRTVDRYTASYDGFYLAAARGMYRLLLDYPEDIPHMRVLADQLGLRGDSPLRLALALAIRYSGENPDRIRDGFPGRFLDPPNLPGEHEGRTA